MIENLIIALNTVLPLFFMIGAGYVAKICGIITPAAALQANSMCFRLFLSALMFSNIYHSDLQTAFHIPLLLFCVGGILLEFLLGLLFIPRIEKKAPAQGVMVQAMFRPNIILFGLPMSISLFGADQVGEMSILICILVPLVNLLAVVDLELFRGGKPNVRKILRGIATNPLILGSLAGVLFLAADLHLPHVIESTIDGFAGVATPLALVLLGVSLDFKRLAASRRNLIICTVLRLIVLPAVFLTAAALLGFRDVALGCVLLAFAPPGSSKLLYHGSGNGW